MLDTRRIELSKKRLEKAHREYDGAILNKNSNYYEIANTRAYYAAFHAIRALLALDDVDFKKHGSVIGYFNKNYVNTGFVDHSFIETIKIASKSRNSSDYEDYYEATLEEAERNIDGAGKLLTAITQLIEVRLEAEPVQEAITADDFDYNEDIEAEDGIEL